MKSHTQNSKWKKTGVGWGGGQEKQRGRDKLQYIKHKENKFKNHHKTGNLLGKTIKLTVDFSSARK